MAGVRVELTQTGQIVLSITNIQPSAGYVSGDTISLCPLSKQCLQTILESVTEPFRDGSTFLLGFSLAQQPAESVHGQPECSRDLRCYALHLQCSREDQETEQLGQ